MKYKLNEVYYGFKLIDTHEVKEINSTANIFVHEKSGAKLLHLDNDDDNKVFSVAFRTPPSDSTGVPHIVEHCVLSGSRKYKTKEPFMDLVKGSLKTFINAMTFSDKTIYPVASKNNTDFENLMDVYLDAVYFPMIHEEKEIFMQEGWHYDIHDKKDPIIYKGVVYNEMRGAYSSPATFLREVIGRSIFPNNTYQHSSGGNPDVITDLTLEDFKKFHKDYYHPNNSYIYIYGNGDLNKYLEHMNEDYLSKFDSERVVDSKIKLQELFTEKIEINEEYGVSDDESLDKKTFLSMNFLLGDGIDPINHFIADILKDILVNASASPVKRALLKAGIGEDISCSTGGGLQISLSIVAKNAELDQKEEFEKVIYETLNKLILDGIDKKLIDSSINIVEYSMREATGFATKGIIYHILSLDSWLYDGHPTNMISYNDNIAKMREYSKTDFFEKYILENLINNSHTSIVTLVPKKGVAEEKIKKTEEKLLKYKNSLSDLEIEELIKENIKLKEKQLSPDSAEALATMPSLTVMDVNKKSDIIPTEVIDLDGDNIINHEIFSNGIAYLEFLFDVSMISQENIQYVNLLSALVGSLDTKQYSYGDLSNEIYKETGGVNLSPRVYSDTKLEGVFYPKLILSGKVVTNKLGNIFRFMNILIKDTLFEDKNRIKELLLQLKSRLEVSINNNGNVFVQKRVASSLVASSKYSEILSGFEYYWFISDILKDFDKNSDELLAKLTSIYSNIFNRNNVRISFTGDKESFNEFKKQYTKVFDNVSKEEFKSVDYKFELKQLKEGITSSSNVQYVAKGFNIKKFGYKFNGTMQILKTILNSEYLHDRVRAKGGAYGCAINIFENGNCIVSSYRDPNLSETLNVYDEMHKYIETLEANDGLTKFIIGAISRVDSAMTARGKGTLGTANYICSITYEDIQRERDEILNVTLDDLKSLSKMIKNVMENGSICVYGNDLKIKEDKDIFENIILLNK